MMEMDDNRVMPYNFVPLGSQRANGTLPDPDDRALLHGWLRCTLTTQTPLIIPDLRCDHAFPSNVPGHSTYEFFSYEPSQGDLPDDGWPGDGGPGDGGPGGGGPGGTRKAPPADPVIPGSALRGMVRAAYEAAANGCLSTLSDAYLQSARTPMPRMPGLLHYAGGQWQLFAAQAYGIKTGPGTRDPNTALPRRYDAATDRWYIQQTGGTLKYYTGDPIDFDTGPGDFVDTASLGSGRKKGYLLLGEDFGTKKYHDHLFVRSGGGPTILQDADIEDLQTVLALYRSEKVNKHLVQNGRPTARRTHRGYAGYSLSIAREGGYLPVFYDVFSVPGHVQYYLAPGTISRSMFHKKIRDIAGEQGHYDPCDKRDDLCPACALFGMVGKGRDADAVGGRVRFGDAHRQDAAEPLFCAQLHTLPELLGPKISSMEFYTDTKNESLPSWTYDYATSGYARRGQNTVPVREAFAPGDLRLKGRKFYWHHDPHGRGNAPPTRFNCTVRPVDRLKRFDFTVYFDGVTLPELERLSSILHLGTSRRGHKLGHGKPLGYGSVCIDITDAAIRSVTCGEAGVTYTMRRTCTVDGAEQSLPEHLRSIKPETAFGGAAGESGGISALLQMLSLDAMKDRNVAYLELDWYRHNRGSILRPQLKRDALPDILSAALGAATTSGTAPSYGQAAPRKAPAPPPPPSPYAHIDEQVPDQGEASADALMALLQKHGKNRQAKETHTKGKKTK